MVTFTYSPATKAKASSAAALTRRDNVCKLQVPEDKEGKQNASELWQKYQHWPLGRVCTLALLLERYRPTARHNGFIVRISLFRSRPRARDRAA